MIKVINKIKNFLKNSKKRVYIVLFLIFGITTLIWLGYFEVGVDFLKSKVVQTKSFLFGKSIDFFKEPFNLGWDFLGGTKLVFRVDLSEIEKKHHAQVLEGLKTILEQRLFLLETESVLKIENQRLIIELTYDEDIKTIKEQINQEPLFEFREQDEEGMGFKSTELTGKYLKDVLWGVGQDTMETFIFLQFDEEGAEIFEELTERNIGKILGIFIDDILLFPLQVNEKIPGGEVQIRGDFTLEIAEKLGQSIKASSFSSRLELLSQESLGKEEAIAALDNLVKACFFSFLAVVLLMILFFRLPGLISSLVLAIYIGLVLIFFKIIPINLTLASISAFIFSIGMTINDDILILSRTKEELKKGKSYGVVIEESFRRVLPLIRDNNLTTLFIMGVLFSFGTEFIKDFVFVLFLGILISLFLKIFMTKKLFRGFEGTKLEKITCLWK